MEPKFVEAMVEADDNLEDWQRVLEAVEHETAMGTHDVRLVAVDADEIVLEMPLGDHARQVVGLLHGGVSAMLAETAASMHSSWGLDVSTHIPVGIELNASHIRTAEEGTIRAVGEVIKRGSTHVRHRVEIRHLERDVLLSDCRVTNFIQSRSSTD